MALTGALTLALALVAGAPEERVLLCRPRIVGDAVLARGDAIARAATALGARLLDYATACEDAAEAARAARRAGLAHAIATVAEGRVEGTRYLLVLADADGEAERARRSLEIAPGADAARPLRTALAALTDAVPREGPAPARIAAWTLVGAGAVALAAGAGFALAARDAADRANGAGDPATYTRAREDWRARRTASGVLLGVGGAAVAGGLAWRFVF